VTRRLMKLNTVGTTSPGDLDILVVCKHRRPWVRTANVESNPAAARLDRPFE